VPTEPHVFTPEQAAPLIAWVNERHSIYMRKEIILDAEYNGLTPDPPMSAAGQGAWGKGGWTLDRLTDDPILREYKFTNILRELDRTTIWIREHIREPFADHPNLWWMLAVSRFVNHPAALAEYIADGGWPNAEGFTPKELTRVSEARRARGDKVESPAYLIRPESHKAKPWYSWSKQRYVSEIALGFPWRDREIIQDFLTLDPTLEETWTFFMGAKEELDWMGWGSFTCQQVVCDMRWTRYLHSAPDRDTWTAAGPGSMRGLNRLAGRPVGKILPQEQFLEEITQLREMVNENTASWVPPLIAMDLSNALCEVDKYQRVKLGQGRPRSKYKPTIGE